MLLDSDTMIIQFPYTMMHVNGTMFQVCSSAGSASTPYALCAFRKNDRISWIIYSSLLSEKNSSSLVVRIQCFRLVPSLHMIGYDSNDGKTVNNAHWAAGLRHQRECTKFKLPYLYVTRVTVVG